VKEVENFRICTFDRNLLSGCELHEAEGERRVISGAEDQVPVVRQLVQHVQDGHLEVQKKILMVKILK
jgi:hypothetical protein